MIRGIVLRAAGACSASSFSPPPVPPPSLPLLLSVLLVLLLLLLLLTLLLPTAFAVAMLSALLFEKAALRSPAAGLLLSWSSIPPSAPPIAVEKRALSRCPFKDSGLHM
jgi:hypothetical protein